MRTVTIYFRYRIPKKKKRAAVALLKQHYDGVRWTDDYARFKVAERDSRYIWLCVFSKAFLIDPRLTVRFDP